MTACLVIVLWYPIFLCLLLNFNRPCVWVTDLLGIELLARYPRRSMSIIRGYVLLPGIVGVALQQPAYAAPPTVIAAVNYPPYHVAEPVHDQRQGVSVDLVLAALKSLKASPTLTFVPMSRAKESLFSQGAAGLLGAKEWFNETSRSHDIEAIHLAPIEFVFFYHKHRFPEGVSYDQLQELLPYTIGSVRGSSTLPLLTKAQLKLDLVADVEQNFKKLSAGRLDLVAAVDLSGWQILKQQFPGTYQHYDVVKKPFFTTYASLLILKENRVLIKNIRQALVELHTRGEYLAIIQRYYRDQAVSVELVPQWVLDAHNAGVL